ncbi:FAD-binding oxidoreductase [Leekyejoonella antrihumi]|uniref:FAD-binding oxidoreductase n=1 Tax=Leekyejoonella antrihumi TaxID=1660198 RepID=A0A563E9Z8_9MICO|nr:FAD-binding oxidoreductase [Leekyejoonella antrihumi]TWP38614.1 FAD-binding oxidoreductase [Leekyejoonella antrihumi]
MTSARAGDPARAGVRRSLTGWGRTAASVADVFTVDDDEQVAMLVGSAGRRGVLARGLGRSYGDAAQNAGGLVLDMTARRAILQVDEATGVVEVEAGVSMDQLIRELLPLGWFVPVSPGTRQVTVGGAIAADVHGKNHHRDGSFGAHVQELTLVTGDGRVRRVVAGEPLFWATVGGMGLTGVILRARIRMKCVRTSTLLVDTRRCANLDDVLAQMEDDDRYDYSVAWVDCLARGAALGRSVLTRGRFATVDELPAPRRDHPLTFTSRTRLAAPPGWPNGLLNRYSVGAFNEAWFRKAPRARMGQPQSVGAFFHPLDGVAGWNRIYGSSGFLQYQVLVPLDSPDAIRQVVASFSSNGLASFLSVLKRMGSGNPGYLSFPRPGWTLTLDIPAGDPATGMLLDRLDEKILEVGGRSYFAKDSRMTARSAHAMYPRLSEWREVRDRFDPNGVFTSDLARRVQL